VPCSAPLAHYPGQTGNHHKKKGGVWFKGFALHEQFSLNFGGKNRLLSALIAILGYPPIDRLESFGICGDNCKFRLGVQAWIEP